ncbi:MAG TPA: protein kinase [Anaerolineales bacterium]|nr:protein kinase [Anaerolineales bacterium]
MPLLADRYRLEAELGRGGMGTVVRARDTVLDRPVAVKTLAASSLGEEARGRLLAEARAAARLNHPNIVSLYDAGETKGDGYIVMELVEGRSLHDRPPESLDKALDVARQICQALAHAHAAGIVHRDLKPENVIVTDDGRVKLFDFGLARPIASRLTAEGGISGTVFYLAPEQAMGKAVDVRADLYSLGVMLYEMSTGRLPFMADDPLAVVTQHLHAPVVRPRTLRPDLPPALDRLIVSLLAKQPEDRPGDAMAVDRVLAEIQQGAPAGEPAGGEEVRIDQLARGRLIGRRAELDRLRQLWSQALDGQGVLALISGEPGVGKTRLARELIATARLGGATVLVGGCYEFEATTPYLPFVEALREWVRGEPVDRLREIVDTSAQEIVRMAPEAEEKLGSQTPRTPLTPNEERLRLFDSLARAFQRMTAPNGLLIFLDDLHWADSGTLQLLHYLIRHLRHDRVLFLVAYREVELDRTHPLAEAIVEWNRERRAVRLPLGRLSEAETAAMLSTLFQSDTISPEFAAAIQRETEGNPFFIEEVVKALIESEVVYREDGRWERKAIEDLAIPQSVKEAIGRRLNRLDAATLDVLHTAAVIGKTFSYGVLQDSLAQGDAALLPALDHATAAQLVAPLEGEAYVFTHDKIRETLYDEVNPIRRRRLHQQVGEALERRRVGDARGRAQDLAYHFTAAGDSRRGGEYSLQAAEQARKLYAWDEAIQFLATARECALGLEQAEEVARLDALIGATYSDKGQFLDAIAAYQRALDATDEPRERARLKISLGDMYTMIGDSRALAILNETIAELDPETQRLELASARTQLARHHHYAAEFPRALELLDQARPVLEELGDMHMLTRTLAHYAGAYQHLGRIDESNRWAERLIRLGESSGHTFAAAVGHEYLAENANICGLFERAAEEARLDHQLGQRIGSQDRVAWSNFSIAWAQSGLGELEAAEQTAREGLEIADRIGEGRLAIWLMGTLVIVLADRGRFEEAEPLLQGLIAAADDLRQAMLQTFARYAAAYLAVRRGDPGSAYPLLEEAMRFAEESQITGARLFVGGIMAETSLALGGKEQARSVAAAHLEIARGAGAMREQVRALRALAAVARADGELARALDLADQALGLHHHRSDPIEHGRTLVFLSSVRLQLGEVQAAQRDLAEAMGIFERVGAVVDLEQARRLESGQWPVVSGP